MGSFYGINSATGFHCLCLTEHFIVLCATLSGEELTEEFTLLSLKDWYTDSLKGANDMAAWLHTQKFGGTELRGHFES